MAPSAYRVLAGEELVSVIAASDGTVIDAALAGTPAMAPGGRVWPPRRALLAILCTSRTAFSANLGEAIAQ